MIRQEYSTVIKELINNNNPRVEMRFIGKKEGISGIGRGVKRMNIIKNTLHTYKVTMKSIFV